MVSVKLNFLTLVNEFEEEELVCELESLQISLLSRLELYLI